MAEPESNDYYGAFPIDFILQSVIEEGIQIFRDNLETMPLEVFGHLQASYLSKYGTKKIDEIASFINDTDIPIVQNWASIGERSPCISIQLLNGGEKDQNAGLDDFHENIDTIGGGIITNRKEIAYAAMTDTLQIGIHVANNPDLVKYLYYLLVYILVTNGDVLKSRGLQLTTWEATDISRIVEYLPEGLFSRFVNFTAFTTPRFPMRDATIITDIVGVQDSGASPGGNITYDDYEDE